MRNFVFHAAGHRFALDSGCVQAVHPLVRARPVPGGPPWLAGVIDVHGEFVPMVDAGLLLAGSPVSATLGARTLLIDTGFDAEVRARFALAVDRVENAVDLDDSGAWDNGVRSVPWLGAVLQHRGEAAQRFEPRALAAAHPQISGPAAGLAQRGDG